NLEDAGIELYDNIAKRQEVMYDYSWDSVKCKAKCNYYDGGTSNFHKHLKNNV
ncbi:12518_t:CDS:1, partial [Ambispora gerdemannii]